MNPDQITPVVRRWLRHAEATPPDARESARQVMARMPYVRQRSRWLPLPIFGRKASSASSTADREHRFATIRVATTRFPTVIGRTQTMFSPAKAIIGGTLVLALSAAFLVAQPYDRHGGDVPGAEQGAGPAAPVEVTATHRSVECSGYDSSEVEGRVVRVYGHTCTVDNEWSDPRLQGTETYINNYVDDVDGGLIIGHYVHNIATDDGAWQMRPQFRFDSAGPFDDASPEDFSGTWVLDGEDAYEGLSVILAKQGNDLEGFIIESHLLPPAPEDASTK